MSLIHNNALDIEFYKIKTMVFEEGGQTTSTTDANSVSVKRWIDVWKDDFIKALGIDPAVASALDPKIEYSLFVETPNTIISMITESEQFSFQEYMALACMEGLKSIATGNNPIGALMVVREGGFEYIFGGHNRTNTKNSKHFHAEQDAIDAWENWTENKSEDKLLLKRRAPDDKELRMVVTTREPCANMCAGRIINTRPPITKIMIATLDKEGGAMGPGHDGLLAPHAKQDWEERGGVVVVTDYTNYNSSGYINGKYKKFIESIYQGEVFETKETPPLRSPLSSRYPADVSGGPYFGNGLPPAITQALTWPKQR